MLRSAIQPLGTDLGTIARQALGGVRERAVAIGDLKPGQGTVKTELRENAVGLPGMLMHGIAPSCAILAAWRTPTSDSTRRVLNGTCPWDIVKILAAPLARVWSSGYQTAGG
jgi:hypothetical protein